MPRADRDIVSIALLVAFLFAHEFQPSQPLLVPYWKDVLHVPVQRIYRDIFPWATYSLLFMGCTAAASLWVLGLRPTLFLSGLAACAQTCLAVWGNGASMFWMLVLSEVVWAFGFGSLFVVLVAKFTLVPRRYFHAVSSLNKGASLIAILFSSLLGQLVVDKSGMSRANSLRTLRGIAEAYRAERGSTAMWSLCYMVMQADSFLLITYWQTLFNQIDPRHSINGYVFAAARTCGAAASLLPAFFQLIGFDSWKKYSTLLCMALCGVYGAVHACTEMISVICSAQVAVGVGKTPSAEYGWVFGMNYFLSIALQVVMQLAIQSLSIKQGYRVLAGILIFQMLVFMAFAIARRVIDLRAATHLVKGSVTRAFYSRSACPRVLVALSGGPHSLALLRTMHACYVASRKAGARRFDLVAAHVPLPLAGAPCSARAERLRASAASLAPEVAWADAPVPEEARRAWAEIPEASAREEVRGVLVARALAVAAAACGASHVLLGTSATRAAVCALADAARGRGCRVPLDVALCDSVTCAPIVFVRPMRDLLEEELGLFLEANGVAGVARVEAEEDAASGAAEAPQTVGGLAEAFVQRLQQQFDHTAHAVVQTGSKMELPPLSSPRCPLCSMHYRPAEQSTVPLPSPPEGCEGLCYGCRAMLRGCNIRPGALGPLLVAHPEPAQAVAPPS
eukprot:m51a1_g1825 putative cytoplasmic trna 2-thiolation protein 2 a-like (680) ;mRNA; f:512646-515811